MPDFERELDELYGLPGDEFTAARNELAKRLGAAGLAEESDEVKALRKPSAPAALVNRVARERSKEVKALLAAGEALRKAHGRGGAALRDAADKERRAVDSLVAEARLVDPSASDATLARVGSTLQAAAVDPESRTLLQRGRLATEVEPAGFGALAGLSIAAPAEKRSSAKGAARKAAPKRDHRKLDEARAKVKKLRADALAARRAAGEASRAAAEAQVEADSAERDAERAERALEQAEERLRHLTED